MTMMQLINESELEQLETRRFSESEVAPFICVTPDELEQFEGGE